MKILLDSNNVAFYVGQQFTVKDNCVVLSDGSANYSYNTTNTTVIDTDPPEYPVSFAYKWENDAWLVVDQDAIDAYLATQKAAFNDAQSKKRFAAYTVESDPIFFKSQRGEATNQEWLDAIAAIDARFPYQE
jgi:hypothetical protein